MINVNRFSELSNINETVYSKLPNSLYNTNLNIDIINNKKFIKTKNINGSNEIFINLKDNNHDIIYQNSNIQTIEISNPIVNNQENQTRDLENILIIVII